MSDPTPQPDESSGRIEAALRRLGSMEAFTAGGLVDPERDAELLARINYARRILAPAPAAEGEGSSGRPEPAALLKLAPGLWVQASEVLSVAALKGDEEIKAPTRVKMVTRTDGWSWDLTDFDRAKAFADQLAEAVNAALVSIKSA